MDNEFVILVDKDDNEVGSMGKYEAHLKGVLHRAVSVFIFNSKGEMLLQQRAAGKYHSPILWTNACCSHPRIGEIAELAAIRRLGEEMGLVCQLTPVFKFLYKADVGGGLIENEFDHVFIGKTDNIPIPNPTEINDYRYQSLTDLQNEVEEHPETFTVWFRLMLDKFMDER